MAAWIYLETEAGSGLFNCRGEVGPNDDPQSFRRIMEQKGLRVFITAERVGDEYAPEPGARLMREDGTPATVHLPGLPRDVPLELLEGVN